MYNNEGATQWHHGPRARGGGRMQSHVTSASQPDPIWRAANPTRKASWTSLPTTSSHLLDIYSHWAANNIAILCLAKDLQSKNFFHSSCDTPSLFYSALHRI